jgi:SAM-dependent methyltransferase
MRVTETPAFNKIYSFVLGNHPHNTIFAFNYHNVKHIIFFLNAAIKNHLHEDQYLIADIGAGRSPYYFLFASKASKYLAIDLKESLPAGETRQIEPICGIAENVPLADKALDVVLCNQVFEHVEDPLKVTTEAFRILKPDGFFFGSAPHVSPIHLEPNDYWRFTEFGVTKLLNKAGFVDICVEGNGGVHRCAVFMISMDWFLSIRKDGKNQQFSALKALVLSPLIGLMNGFGILMDKIVGDKHRTPANLCWVAKKPK